MASVCLQLQWRGYRNHEGRADLHVERDERRGAYRRDDLRRRRLSRSRCGCGHRLSAGGGNEFDGAQARLVALHDPLDARLE